MKKKFVSFLFLILRLVVPQASQKSEILSDFGIFVMLTSMYFLIINCGNRCSK